MRQTINTGAGVVWRRRRRTGRLEVLIVHRRRQGDWVLPKGRANTLEGVRAAAVREVREESGWRCRPIERLGAIERRDRSGRWRRCTYWLMETRSDDGFTASDEIDERRWVSLDAAAELIAGGGDRCALEWTTRYLACGH